MPNVFFRFSHPTGATGLTVDIAIVRLSDHYVWDHVSNTFKASAWGAPMGEMDEVKVGLTSPPAILDGEYVFEWAVPDVRGVVQYEAVMSESTSGERQTQMFSASDGHVERNSQVAVELDPTVVTPYTLDHAALAALTLALGDMDNLDANSARFLAPVNLKVFAEFSRANGAGGWSRERQ